MGEWKKMKSFGGRNMHNENKHSHGYINPYITWVSATKERRKKNWTNSNSNIIIGFRLLVIMHTLFLLWFYFFFSSVCIRHSHFHGERIFFAFVSISLISLCVRAACWSHAHFECEYDFSAERLLLCCSRALWKSDSALTFIFFLLHKTSLFFLFQHGIV